MRRFPSPKTFVGFALAATSIAAIASPTVANGATRTTKRTPKAPATTTTAAPKPTAAPTTAAPATTAAPTPPKNVPTLKIGTIPDQDPAKLLRQFNLVADYLGKQTNLKVQFVPVSDYNAAVTGFKVGDLDLVWFGGLSGVQAAKQVPNATYIAQRDIDARFKSVFIANTSARIPPIDTLLKLRFLKGLSFTFGSEISTSGRLMPQFFLDEAGVELQDFKGQPGFSGSHDKTLRLVEAGTFDAGAMNKAVWDTAVSKKTVDLEKVRVIYETPPYFDYHWLARPDMDERFGSGTTANIKKVILGMSTSKPEEKEILDLFPAGSFIETKRSNYDQIEKTAKSLNLLS